MHATTRTVSKTAFLVLIASTVLLTGCGSGGIADIALNAIYAYKQANKTVVPETPPAGIGQAFVDTVVMPENTPQSTHLWYTQAARPQAPVLLHFHGNGDNIGTLYQGGFFTKMQEFGTHIVVIDYPAYGRSTGTPTEKSVMTAVDGALAWTKAKFPGSKIVIWGWSLGAAVAAQTATRPEVYKFILTSPWTTTRAMGEFKFPSLVGMVPEEFFVTHKWDSLEAATRTRAKGLIFHGSADDLIPVTMGEQLSQAYAPGQVLFHKFEGRGHGDVFQEQKLWDDIKNFSNN